MWLRVAGKCARFKHTSSCRTMYMHLASHSHPKKSEKSFGRPGMWGIGGPLPVERGAINADGPPQAGRANQRTRRGEGSLVVTVQVVAMRLWSIPRRQPWRPQRERRQSSRTSCFRVGSGHGFPCLARGVARRVTRVRNVRRNYRQQAYWWHPYQVRMNLALFR